MKTAIISGICGQDGAYLALFLLDKGYKVVGAERRSASGSAWRLEKLGIKEEVIFEEFELLEFSTMLNILNKYKPDEFYNLAAQSFVKASFNTPIFTGNATGLGVTRILEAIRAYNKEIRFYQASSSEMFGKVLEIPQTELTPFYPRSPYAVAKLYGHWMAINYRESYDMFCSNGILFNHESPLRGEEFVTKKITSTLAKIKLGKADILELGNLEAKRDWGFAGDYVEAMHSMLTRDNAEDYVVATGEAHSVAEFVEKAASAIDMDISWEGEGQRAKGIDKKSGKTIVQVNKDFFRPAEVDFLIGDPSKAKRDLKWSPKHSFESLVEMMVKDDLETFK
jgi:GDPmannose 4,6-dehydratase